MVLQSDAVTGTEQQIPANYFVQIKDIISIKFLTLVLIMMMILIFIITSHIYHKIKKISLWKVII